jgi:WD40 repeat protein
MKQLLIISLLLFYSAEILAQKDKVVMLDFVSEDELLISYRSGENAIISIPDLTNARSFAPDDKKNKTVTAELSPKKDRLICFDSKVKQRIVWDVVTGKKITSIPSNYNNVYSFNAQTNELVISEAVTVNKMSYQVYDLETGNKVKDLDDFDLYDYAGISFSPKGDKLVQYTTSSMDDGQLQVFSYPDGEILRKIDLDREGEIKNVLFDEAEEALYFELWAHMASSESQYTLSLVDTDSDAKYLTNDEAATQLPTQSKPELVPSLNTKGLTDQKGLFIPISLEYKLYNVQYTFSPEMKWSAYVNGDGMLLLYDHSEGRKVTYSEQTMMAPKAVGKKQVTE